MQASKEKALKAILRVRQERLDSLSAKRAKCLADIDFLSSEVRITQDQLDQERHFVGGFDGLQNFAYFNKKIEDTIQTKRKQIEQLHHKNSSFDEDFQLAYEEWKVVEKAYQKVLEEERLKAEKEENQTLDEVGLQQLRQKEG